MRSEDEYEMAWLLDMLVASAALLTYAFVTVLNRDRARGTLLFRSAPVKLRLPLTSKYTRLTSKYGGSSRSCGGTRTNFGQ